ncbi:MAG: fused MFS/spermidine synthase [Terracidiphilus sp.]
MALLDALYALVIFLSAFLLFLVEPMTAKRLLPSLGGSAAVWITCLVFFQSALLAGYLYAHLVTQRLRPRPQAITHAALLGLALVSLAVQIQPGAGSASWHPLFTTLWMLTALIGLPFVALGATTPLLQSWRSGVGSRNGNPPLWRFFAISNLGAMLALVLYPWLIEPNFALRTQQTAWTAGFVVFAIACAALAWFHANERESIAQTMEEARGSALNLDEGISEAEAPINSRRSGVRTEAATYQAGGAARARSSSVPDANREVADYASPRRPVLWVLLPAASSMLLCAITAHLSQNVAAVPLLWIVPLAAYLLSFIVTFAGPNWYWRSYATRVIALALATVGYVLATQISVPLAISIPVFVGALYVFCYFCHGELYRLRPAASQSTSYYLLIALGSALGAIFIGAVAPLLFSLNCDLALSLIFLVALALAATWSSGLIVRIFWTAGFAAMIWAAILNVRILRHDTISQLRGFYGSLRVTQTFAIPGPGIQRTLFNGTIQHGIQVFNDQLRHRGTSYYAPDSGVGLALRFCCHGAPRRIGAVGLGVGTIAAYAEPGDSITFYEIDPLVERLARARFAYLRECRAPVGMILGDARLSMEQQPPQNYDVIVLDAFSGDAIPVHLLTAQAIALYRRHLKPGGVLAFHISSQYVDLAPVLAAEARHADMIALGVHSLANDEEGEYQADWVLMSADPGFFRQPEVAIASRPIALRPGLPLWTDDFNSLLPLVKWTGFETGVPPGANGK